MNFGNISQREWINLLETIVVQRSMERLQVAVLDASYNDGHVRRNFRREIGVETIEFDVTRGDLPKNFDFDAIVVTGSRASVYWEDEWIEELIEWLGESVKREIPHLGVCFGHQILAVVLGGKVESMEDFEIGYNEIQQVRENKLLEGIPETFVSFSTHGDAVTKIPPESLLIAENEYGIQGWNKGNIWTVQFHPEYDLKTIKDTTPKKEGPLIPRTKIEKILAESTKVMHYKISETKRLFDNFIELAGEMRQHGTN